MRRLTLPLLGATLCFPAWGWQVEKVAGGFAVPWGMSFVDNDTLLVTERNGGIKQLTLSTGAIRNLFEVEGVWARGQGGLLDIAVSPFDPGKVYVTYSKDVNGQGATTLAVADYRDGNLTNWRDVLVSRSTSDTGRHFGSRIAFDQSHVYFSIGDRGNRDNGQNTQTHAAAILRLNPNGSIPQDNPFVKDPTILDEIWTYGHRNPQGLTYDIQTQQLWEIEHGPRGGDEINRIQKGKNYGWPVTSHGKEYWGPLDVGDAKEKPGIEPPVKVYVPSIAPGSLILYRGDKYPALNGKLLSGSLKLTHINIVSLNDNFEAVGEERILQELGERIRDIEVSPQGWIYFSTDRGNVYQLKP
ncbi:MULTISPECIES: PQQ-dependent sugar dehydrogenase [unclassified Vibrio]|uniref:PQQ-dependent sugar dehydrogenase n=1 Tax=unclassified Vibrio TaxID=2614977 RepID=UPI0013615DEF|nr:MULTISPECIES: PQQ-dependent sugar dehydrogenase [unclassified Vibrio]NAW59598.1 PQQ-dependent sugar dehydrogenase [Vibrio sp. V36_P2S2PM302]NAX25665.1 PQQ-dependent sugar dehydrogenase [Vibrio sp. V38_P2S17PM301]NAX31057.1 PQQ-dependent sugar dehydrogenase [Vibrio sp. V37_P2S8PM304]